MEYYKPIQFVNQECANENANEAIDNEPKSADEKESDID